MCIRDSPSPWKRPLAQEMSPLPRPGNAHCTAYPPPRRQRGLLPPDPRGAGVGRGGWGGAPDQGIIINFWTELNKTKSAEVVQISDRTTAHYYRNGTDDNEVWHYKVKGFGHRIPGAREMGDTAFDVVWQFFSKF